MTDVVAYVKVATLDDIPDDQGICVVVGGLRVGLFRDGDEVFAIDNICPHEGGPLADGFYDDRVVTCPLHAWEIDVTTGRVRGGIERVRTFPVRVAADRSVEVCVG